MVTHLNTLAQFLARRDIGDLADVKADVLVLLGNALPGTARVAAGAWHAGVAPAILVSGGVGHSTSLLWEAVRNHPEFGTIPVAGRPEADIFRDILAGYLGVDRSAILIENESTNCGANAWASKLILNPLDPAKVVLIQDPTMQRRTHASFERTYRGESAPEFISFSPFVPQVSDCALIENFPDGLWTFERFVDLILGEVPRLTDDEHGYGPKGKDYVEHVEIPDDVLESYKILTLQFAAKRAQDR